MFNSTVSLYLLASFIVAALIIKILVPIAQLMSLVDVPGGRKHHQGSIPLIGGIAVFSTVSICSMVYLEQDTFARLFVLAGGLIVFMGALDDKYQLSARYRLTAQFLIAGIFTYGLNITIDNYGSLLGFGDIYTGILCHPLTIFSLVAAINGFNMLDGMDGLVGALALTSFAALTALFAVNGALELSTLCVLFVGAISAFLIFNLLGAPNGKIHKVFMGDAGSMFIGLALGVLLIKGSQGAEASFEPVMALWFVLLPVTDMATIMYRRIKRGRSPMAPDRTHIHHILMRAGLSRTHTLMLLVTVQLAFIGIGVSFSLMLAPQWMSMVLAVAFILLYQLLMKRSWKFVKWSNRKFRSRKLYSHRVPDSLL